MVAQKVSHGTVAARAGSVKSGMRTIRPRYTRVYPSVSLNPGRTERLTYRPGR
jgi:hypothetical protein